MILKQQPLLCKQSGFTITELIVAFLLIGIIAVFATPRWTGGNLTLFAQTQQLLDDIHYVQDLAMTSGERYAVNFITPNSYTITDANGNLVKNPNTGAMTVTFKTGVTFGALTNLPNSLIAFDEWGIPYTDAATNTALTSTASISLTSSGTSRLILISPGTGSMDIQ